MTPHFIIAMVVLAGASPLYGRPDKEPTADRIARLIRQLGHEEFVRREAASRELDAIGAPALDALRKASSNDDAEIRRRAELLVRTITDRIRAAVTKKELVKLQGTWWRISFEKDGRLIGGEDKSHTFTIKGDKWWTHFGGRLFNAGTISNIDVKQKHNTLDLWITEGSEIGATALYIYAVEGDTLKALLCGGPRATDFTTKPGDGRHYGIFRRVKP
jgi:uncharacterized protein (TIGR03067 family)